MSNADCSDSEFCGYPGRFNDEGEHHLLHIFENCTTLFGLLNVRESLGLARDEQVCPLNLEEYEHAEMLAAGAFLQILTEECEPEYENKIVQWFGPSESVLVMYYNKVG